MLTFLSYLGIFSVLIFILIVLIDTPISVIKKLRSPVEEAEQSSKTRTFFGLIAIFFGLTNVLCMLLLAVFSLDIATSIVGVLVIAILILNTLLSNKINIDKVDPKSIKFYHWVYFFLMLVITTLLRILPFVVFLFL